MKYGKMVTLVATLLVVSWGLVACGSDKSNDGSETSTSKVEKESADSSNDVVTGASISDKADEITNALSEKGNWIVAVTGDITFEKDLSVAGEFHDKGEKSGEIYRKLALYSQDKDRKVTDEYTITVPKLVVESENFNIVHGSVNGDIEVKANGFILDGTKVEGNIIFENEEYKESAILDKDGASVAGEVTVTE